VLLFQIVIDDCKFTFICYKTPGIIAFPLAALTKDIGKHFDAEATASSQTCQHQKISKRVTPRTKSRRPGQSPKGHSLMPEGPKVEAKSRGGVGFGGGGGKPPSLPASPMIFHCWSLEKASPEQKVSTLNRYLQNVFLAGFESESGSRGFCTRMLV